MLAGDDVREAAVVHLEELLPQLPSLSWAAQVRGRATSSSRGIGELEQYQGAPNPSVGFLVDEIDFSGIGMIASTFDVEQVEVLRGPQGTRYGANALGGLIKVKTRDPVPVRELDTELSLGGDGLWSAGAAAGGALPTGDSTRAPGAPCSSARSATDSARTGTSGATTRTGATRRRRALKFRLESEHGWRADLALLHADFDNGYDAFAIDNSFTTLSDRPGKDSQRSDGASLDLARAALGDGELRSITAWAESDIVASFDGDWGNERDWGAAGPYDFFSDTRRTATDAVRGPAPLECGGRRRVVDRGPVAAAPRGGEPHIRRRPLSRGRLRARTRERLPRDERRALWAGGLCRRRRRRR